jgi:hypothetical protein
MSTYKLHIRTPEDIQSRDRSTLEIFETTVAKNLQRLTEKKNILQKRGLLKNGKYIGEIQVSLKDAMLKFRDVLLLQLIFQPQPLDKLILAQLQLWELYHLPEWPAGSRPGAITCLTLTNLAPFLSQRWSLRSLLNPAYE